jgi:hypothetical protein
MTAAAPQSEGGGAGGIIKTVVIVAVALAALVGLGLLALSFFGGGAYSATNGSVQIVELMEFDRDNRPVYEIMIIPHKKQAEFFDGRLIRQQRSLCGRKAIALVREGDAEELVLYYISNNIRVLSDEVASAWLAPSGNQIAYTKYERPDWENPERATTLFVSNGKNERKVTDDFLIGSNVVMSPDGKTLGYVVHSGRYDRDTRSWENERLTGVIWRNGKETELGRDITPVAVANGAKFIYFNRATTDSNDWPITVLNVQRGFNENRRERLGDGISATWFNRDLSQIIFTASTNSGSRSFISVNGRERQQLTGSVSSFAAPYGIASFGNILGFNNFKNTFYVSTEAALLRIKGNWETERIHSSVDGAVFLADNGKTLTYMRNANTRNDASIFRVNGMKNGAEPDRIVDRDGDMFASTKNGKAIFYRNDDGDVIFQRGRNETTVSSERSRGWTIFKGTTLFYINDENELLFSSGNRGTRISGLDGDVQWVSANMHDILVQTRDGNDTLYYHSTNGRTFRKVN